MNQNFNHEQDTEQKRVDFSEVIEINAAKNRPEEGCYMKEGLWYCGKCKTPKQYKASNGKVYPVSCQCESEKKETEKRKAQKQAADKRRKAVFGGEKNNRVNFTFETDDGRSPFATKALRSYCNNFEKYRKNGEGVLLYSDKNSSGKTFLACAVANALIDLGYSIRVTNFSDLHDELQNYSAFKYSSKIDFLQKLRCYDLIIIDDLGAEGRESPISTQYRIINDLTENCVPLIFTTNYTLREMNETTDRDKKRVFERVFGSCALLNVDPPDGKSRRLEKCKQITTDFRNLAAGDHA